MKRENTKENNYQIGAIKRKLKVGRGPYEPGALITKMNAQKEARSKEGTPSTTEKVSIMGAI